MTTSLVLLFPDAGLDENGRRPGLERGLPALSRPAGGIAALGPDAGRDGSPASSAFVLFFTAVTAAVYSLIPYSRRPGTCSPSISASSILAGNGVALLLRAAPRRFAKILVVALLVPGFADLARQSGRASYERPADPANPYVYAQTSPDLLKLVAAVERVAAAAPEKTDLLTAPRRPARGYLAPALVSAEIRESGLLDEPRSGREGRAGRPGPRGHRRRVVRRPARGRAGGWIRTDLQGPPAGGRPALFVRRAP